MRFPEFEAMIGPAKLYPELWRLLLGLLVVAFCYAGGTALLSVALFLAVGPIEYFGWLRRVSLPQEPAPTLMLLATFAGMLLGPVLAAGACHFRGPGTLFGPWGEFRRSFASVLAVTLPLYAVPLGLALAFEAPVENLPWEAWMRWLPYALPLILLQVTAEEALFRGYLQQQLAARFAARWVWMVVPSALFASLHWNPTAGDAVWLVIGTTFLFALIVADLTARTGSLGAAVGLHFVNNAYGMLVISISGSLTGLAKWVTPFELGESAPVVFSLALNLAMLAVLWRLLVWVLDR
ncbi:MAG: CPBP family intramembrane metalloprotease [Paracoccaceae bacterium]|nr:CPBP family intramembrane metalloprotease [Paracoccaceae bacterium]